MTAYRALSTNAAIDIAAWDIACKSYGRRVCDLLGGATGPTVQTYYAISVASPEETARVAREKQQEGYSRLQLKIGGRDLEEDIETLHRVKEVLKPGMRLAADGNRSLTARDTLLISRRCQEVSMILEQPCRTYEEVASIHGRLCHPLYLDEVTEDVNAVIKSIADGYGVALSDEIISARDLDEGRLVQPLQLAVPAINNCYCICTEANRERQDISYFIDWLLTEATNAGRGYGRGTSEDQSLVSGLIEGDQVSRHTAARVTS
ncbi:hypothetical protein OE766_00055 [Pararhizobium sp. YC-54]|uniref:enolase C-terminal domain-like protein n=1 Tax=Pararhizobium sp. YC-54 TaxID=2986920 RepID=UPI0021F707D6|nr:enolase C-terminal domain-like protein [Pararhizobium sp. YC-54]MCV9996637.1 hypothetical protein [Pararhizobium sp. YC-54]